MQDCIDTKKTKDMKILSSGKPGISGQEKCKQAFTTEHGNFHN